MPSMVLITLDTSDLRRIGRNMSNAAKMTPGMMLEALNVAINSRKQALRGVTPMGTRPSSTGHLRDSYYVGLSGTTATLSTSDGDKWNIVNADFTWQPVYPISKQALSWPGMWGPYTPLGKPGRGYSVCPVANSMRRHGEKAHKSMNLLDNMERERGGDAADMALMQAIADSVSETIVSPTEAAIPSMTTIKRNFAKGGFGLPGVGFGEG
jgi:hypothetical protein